VLLYVAAVRGDRASSRMASWLNWRALQFLGLVSYSLYLVHNPLSGAGFFVGYRLLGRSAWTEAVCLVAVFAFCALGAWLFFLLVERPSLRWSHRAARESAARVPELRDARAP
jgi:peptidoglycan/LPS O-acetylase OafA/YrhL